MSSVAPLISNRTFPPLPARKPFDSIHPYAYRSFDFPQPTTPTRFNHSHKCCHGKSILCQLLIKNAYCNFHWTNRIRIHLQNTAHILKNSNNYILVFSTVNSGKRNLLQPDVFTRVLSCQNAPSADLLHIGLC